MKTVKTPTPAPIEPSVSTALKLWPELAGKIQGYAETHYLSLPEALRFLVEAGLATEERAMVELRFQDGPAGWAMSRA